MERFSELEKSTVNQLLQAITVHDDPARIIHGAVKAAESLGTNPNFRNLNELFLRRLTESLGEKLMPCLVYLGKHRNEALVAETERSPVLVTEFLVSVLKSAEKFSAEVAILLFKILQMVVPKEPGPQVQQLSRISMSVLRRSREHAERFAEIIVHLATDPDYDCPLTLKVMAKKLHSWFMGPRENPPVNAGVEGGEDVEENAEVTSPAPKQPSKRKAAVHIEAPVQDENGMEPPPAKKPNVQVGVEGGEDPGMPADLLNDEDLPAEVILPPKQASKRKPAALVEAQADVEIEMLPPPAKKPSVQPAAVQGEPMEVEPLVVVPIVVEPIVVLEPMVVAKRRTPTRRRRPVPLHPPTRQLRALAKTAAAGADVTWNHYEPFVQPAATHDANGVALRRSQRRAAHEGNVKRVFRTNAYNAVAE